MDITTSKYFWDSFNAKTTFVWELSLSWFKPKAQFSVGTANHKTTELAKERLILYNGNTENIFPDLIFIWTSNINQNI